MPAEPLFKTSEIQGDILVGLPKRSERLIFFKITDPKKFKAALKTMDLTSMQTVIAQRDLIAKRKKDGIEALIPTPGLNIAFTFAGLRALGVSGIDGAFAPDTAFRSGMAARTAILNDPAAADWAILKTPDDLHGVFIVTGASAGQTANIVSLNLAPSIAQGWTFLHEEVGLVRPQPTKGHEHFGFADGVSQPGVRGKITASKPLTPRLSKDPDQGMPGQDLLWPGEFLFGYPGQDPNASKFTVPGPKKTPPIAFMENGAFLVFRKLAQLVPEFNVGIATAALTPQSGKEMPDRNRLAAQVVGRWKSGAALIKTPLNDDPNLGDGTKNVNDFEFDGDRAGLDCPWAAHVRKAYPRNDVFHNLTPNNKQVDKAEAGTQTHRMMRRGIAYGPELTEAEAISGKTKENRGLLFLCYVTSIEDQFEFVQQSWVDAPAFSQAGAGIDPIIGQTPQRPFLGAAPVAKNPAQKPLFSFVPWVVMQGGAYFFAPSLKELSALS